jgi:hypothetical protein
MALVDKEFPFTTLVEACQGFLDPPEIKCFAGWHYTHRFRRRVDKGGPYLWLQPKNYTPMALHWTGQHLMALQQACLHFRLYAFNGTHAWCTG